jgi:hypothetical protein
MLKSQKVRNRIAGRWKLEVGSIDDFLRKRRSTGNLDGLRTMMSFTPPGAA